jgi:hypothetical protein
VFGGGGDFAAVIEIVLSWAGGSGVAVMMTLVMCVIDGFGAVCATRGALKIRIVTYVSGIAPSKKSGDCKIAHAPPPIRNWVACGCREIKCLSVLGVRKDALIERTPKCAPACLYAVGYHCECSCMGANHGTGHPGGRWHEVSDTFAFNWGPKQYACRLIAASPAGTR